MIRLRISGAAGYGYLLDEKPAPALVPAPPPALAVRSGCSFTIPGAPLGKPRMTQRDRWAKRPAVLRYRAWADYARAAAPANLPTSPGELEIIAYLPMPASWSCKKRRQCLGKAHRAKPDADNIAKAAMDSLWEDDSGIARLVVEKRWEDAAGARLEVRVRSAQSPG